MKNSKLARQLDLMSDYIGDHTPDVALAYAYVTNHDAIDDLIGRLLPTEDEVTAVRIGAIAGLMYARDMLAGEKEPCKPDVDARAVIANCIGAFLNKKLIEEDRHE